MKCKICGANHKEEDTENLIMIRCSCGATLQGPRYPKVGGKSNLFTKRHYNWLVDMALGLDLTHEQCRELAQMLEGTNPKYDKLKFITTITTLRNKRSGGI
tara:strand:- start:475 stop:777 length:303 start_codon:yes stop_codon:yes gene_type:complete